MRWFFYNILFAIGYTLMLPKFIGRMRKRGGYKADFGQRLGKFAPEIAARLSEKPRIWVHAVSVGEANLAGTVLNELRRLAPQESFIISTTSSTGHAVCEKFTTPDDVLIYLPIDFPHVVRRSLRIINAKALILTESEFWPNLIRALNRKHIPILLVNGRISDRSAPRYKKLKFFFAPVLKCFSALLVQSEIDGERLLDAGAPAEKIKVMGSVKFDVPLLADSARAIALQTLATAGIEPATHTILLGASTWPGEEVALVEAWDYARRASPNLRLVLVPRHMERGNEVEKALNEAGFSCLRRSRMKVGTEKTLPSADTILMVDTTGELFALCAMADIVFVGKTLDPNIGGQNMIEPASFGKAVIVGPHTENFAAVMNVFRREHSILEIADAKALVKVVADFATDQPARRELGARALTVVDQQRGALARSAEVILAELGSC